MPDYQKGRIYKLWSPQGTEEEVYYGSTTDELRKRKNAHKIKNNNCSSKILFEKYDDVRIELVEEYPCNNRAELEKKEGEYIRNNKCLNKIIVGRTLEEYYQDNKEYIRKIHKNYRENNKEYIKKINENYRENNKEQLAEKSKKYYENNKEKMNEKHKDWVNNNKEYIIEKRKEKITCECGCIILKEHIKRHQKNSKHIKLMEEKIN
jgi:hypothetical protein